MTASFALGRWLGHYVEVSTQVSATENDFRQMAIDCIDGDEINGYFFKSRLPDDLRLIAWKYSYVPLSKGDLKVVSGSGGVVALHFINDDNIVILTRSTHIYKVKRKNLIIDENGVSWNGILDD